MLKKALIISTIIFLQTNVVIADTNNTVLAEKPNHKESLMINTNAPTAELTADMSIKKKKSKLNKFAKKNDLWRSYNDRIIEKIDWSKVEADLPIEYYQLIANHKIAYINPQYITDKTTLVKILNFVDRLKKENDNFNNLTTTGKIESFINQINWNEVSDNGISETLMFFISNDLLDIISNLKYQQDEKVLNKLKAFIEKRNCANHITEYFAKTIINDQIPESYIYALEQGYFDYTINYSIKIGINNETYLNNLVQVIEKMLTQNYSKEEIRSFTSSNRNIIRYTTDIQKLLLFIEKNYAKDLRAYAGRIDNNDIDFVYLMYEKGYLYNTIFQYQKKHSIHKEKANIAVNLIDTMLKNNYSINETMLLLDSINLNEIDEIPQEFYIAIEKHLTINTLNKKELEYIINAQEPTSSVLSNFAKIGVNISELNNDAVSFIENQEHADSLKTTLTKKEVDEDIIKTVLNSDKVAENKKLKTIQKLQAVRTHNKKHYEHLKGAGYTALYSMYGGAIIAITWPLCATFAITSAIIDKPRQLYYIPRYIEAKNLGLNLK